MKEFITAGSGHRLEGQVIAEITHQDLNMETGEYEGSKTIDFNNSLTAEEKEGIKAACPKLYGYTEV